MVTFTLLSDSDDDGIFDDTDILSVKVMQVQAVRGYSDVFARVADGMGMRVVVNNGDDGFYLERAVPKNLRIGRWMQLKVDNTILCTGILREVNKVNRMQAELIIGGRLLDNQQKIDLPLYENTGVDTILADVFTMQKMNLYNPIKHTSGVEFCVIGEHDIGSCYIWDDDVVLTSFATAQSILPYFGGVYDASPTLERILSDLVTQEYGYLYESADGTITFKDRYHLINNRTSQKTVTEQDEIQYKYGADILGEVRARVSPRIVSAETLYTSQKLISIRREDSVRRFAFRSEDGRVKGLSGNPVLNFAFEDNTGAVVTDVAFNIQKIGDSWVDVWFSNAVPNRYLSIGSTISGTALIQAPPVDVVVVSESYDVGRRVRDLGYLSFTDEENCRSMLSYVQIQYDSALGFVKSVTVNRSLSTWLALDLLDIVTVTSNEMNHSRDYRISGIKLMGTAGMLELTYELAPVVEDNYLVIGVTGRNTIGTNYIIGY